MKLNPILKAAMSAVLLKDLKEKDAIVRSDADSYMLDMNRATGAKTFEVSIEGIGASNKVSVPIATASVAEKSGSWNIEDMEAFTDFMAEAGWADVTYSIEPSAIGAVEQARGQRGDGEFLRQAGDMRDRLGQGELPTELFGQARDLRLFPLGRRHVGRRQGRGRDDLLAVHGDRH